MITRRNFLSALGAASAVLVSSAKGISFPPVTTGADALELLVVGDSVAWGQGLIENDKFYSLTAEWLRKKAFGASRDVNVKVKAHSGSTLKFHHDVADKYKTAGRDERFHYQPEIYVPFPSSMKQIEIAADEYKAAGKTGGAGMIMLTGGITDITVPVLLDPDGDIGKLPAIIEKHCRDDMFDVIDHAAKKHPRALIVVVGYFPMVSPKTSWKRLVDATLEATGFPRFFKPLANNALSRRLFFKKIRKQTIARSRIWFDESNKSIKAAVDKLNAACGVTRAVFVKSPITEDTCFETANSMLFKMGGNGVVEDPLFGQRAAECAAGLAELKRSTGIDYPVRRCAVGALGHPNQAGARAYAEAIKTALEPIMATAIR